MTSTILILIVLLIIALLVTACVFWNNYRKYGILGLIGTAYIFYSAGTYIVGDYYIFAGSLFLIGAMICLYLILQNKIQLKIYFKDLKNNSNLMSPLDKEIILISLCLFFLLIACILIGSPIINQYIQSIGSSTSGEIISSSSTAVVIATTLGLSFFTPVFSFILSVIKENRKNKEKDQNEIWILQAKHSEKIERLEKEIEELKKR